MKALSRKPDLARELFGSSQSGLQVCSVLDYACAAVISRFLTVSNPVACQGLQWLHTRAAYAKLVVDV